MGEGKGSMGLRVSVFKIEARRLLHPKSNSYWCLPPSYRFFAWAGCGTLPLLLRSWWGPQLAACCVFFCLEVRSRGYAASSES
jgi:hypothetical protein